MAQAISRSGANVRFGRDQGELILVVDEALNDSDKTLIVPAGLVWQVLWLRAELISTGTGGNRQIRLQLLDGSSDVLFDAWASAVQAASVTRTYMFRSGISAPYAGAVDDFGIGIPEGLFLPTGYGVQVTDSAAIDAAADDLDLQMMVLEYVAGA